MTKKELVITAVCSFLTGVFLGLLLAPKSGKVVIKGSNNTVRTGYKSYDGNHNGNHNSSANKMNKQKKKHQI